MSMEINAVKEKIRKLFAMADPEGGASQAEIESALIAARKLMFKYKLTKTDLNEKAEANIITYAVNEVSFTTQVNPWIHALNSVIADNYCCHACTSKAHGAKTRHPALVGFEADVELAKEVLVCAVNLVLKEFEGIRYVAKFEGHTHAETTAMLNAMGNGFVRGLREKFEEQTIAETNNDENCSEDKTQSFAVVMATPKEVEDYVNGRFKKTTFNSSKATRNARQYDALAVQGYRMGKDFSMHDKIAANS